MLTKTPGQTTRIDSCDTCETVCREEFIEPLLSPVVRMTASKFANDDAPTEHPARFCIINVDPIVADVWVGKRDELAGIARVGDDLLIPR